MDIANATVNATIPPDTLMGKVTSSSIIFLMAVIPLYIGSIRSLAVKKNSKDLEILDFKECSMFPVNASCALFGIYLVFKVISKEIINKIVTVLFSVSGFFSLSRYLIDWLGDYMPKYFANSRFTIDFKEFPDEKPEEPAKKKSSTTDEKEEEGKDSIMFFDFEKKHFPLILLALVITLAYAFTKNWFFNNIFGLVFALTALEYLHLGKFANGFMLLGGLFFYDIFWVFGTDVMVTVAKGFDAPIKVTFPRDIFTDGLLTSRCSMLGLGDIVIPGAFVSLLYRFDDSLNPGKGNKFYFHVGYLAYILGLLCTYFVMYYFEHAQPALLYLSPACTLIPTLAALIKGDLSKMLQYSDSDKKDEETVTKKK